MNYKKEIDEMRAEMSMHITPDSDPYETMMVLMSKYMYEHLVMLDKTEFVAHTEDDTERLLKSRMVLQSVLHKMNEFAPNVISTTEDLRGLLLGANCEQVDFMMTGLGMGLQQGLMWVTDAVEYVKTVIGGDGNARTS